VTHPRPFRPSRLHHAAHIGGYVVIAVLCAIAYQAGRPVITSVVAAIGIAVVAYVNARFERRAARRAGYR
jgi:hypothetical protein